MSTAVSETVSADSTPSGQPCREGCRFCGNAELHLVVDLGMSPLCENFLSREQLLEAESFYPLRALFCEECGLMQVEEYVGGREIFSTEYMYFSSYSDSWLRHAKQYAEQMIDRFGLDDSSFVVELASNDGYLLKNFVERGVPCLGIEPAGKVAEAARSIGVPTRIECFGTEVAKQMVAKGLQADLLAANNVLAHVPDLNDFVAGMKILLAPGGVITVEFPHLVNLIEGNQFDTIYQEHYCYFSFSTIERIFAAHGITLIDVEELSTHGGSLRIYGRHTEYAELPVATSVGTLRDRELKKGFDRLETYRAFAERVNEVKRGLLEFLINARRQGKRIAAYGAPGKGNTLLNFCGIREDFVEYAVDRNPYKHGRYLPGTHIPVFAPEKIAETRPDYVLILPWNLKEEIVNQLAYVREWGASSSCLFPNSKFAELVTFDAGVVMKVVLFCGGTGMRLREYSESIPKPMVPIGYRPMLWHVMKYYAHFGHKDFILCLGWKANVIKEYFLNYDECVSNDFVLEAGGNSVRLLSSDIQDWNITFVDTGTSCNVGQRLLRVQPLLAGEKTFLANYTDGLCDLHLPTLINFHQRQKAVATFASVRPAQSFHAVTADENGHVRSLTPIGEADVWMNGGFFVFDQDIFSWVDEGEELVLEPFQRLAKAGRLTTHKHFGFWSCMDTYKEKQAIDDRITAGDAPWEIWNRSSPPSDRVQTVPASSIEVPIEPASIPAPVMVG